MARKRKVYFFDSPDTSQGKRFSRYNHPTKEVFADLFDSVPFILEKDDTAKINEAGHVRATSDADAIGRTGSFSDGHTRAVLPHQIPTLTLDGSEILAIGVAVEKSGMKITPIEVTSGGKKRMSYIVEVNPDCSLAVDPVSNKLTLVNDIKTIAPEHEEMFYGIRAGARGFFKPLPDYAVGSLKCRLVPAAGEVPEHYELYWDSSAGDTEIYARKLYGAYSDLTYSGPGKTDLRTFNVGSSNMLLGTTFKISAIFEMAANGSASEVGIEIRTSGGSVAPVPLFSRKDGNVTGNVLLEGEVTLLGDEDTPEYLVFTGKSYNSANPSEVIIHHFNTSWTFAPDATPIVFACYANRASGSATIKNNKFVVELLK